MNKERSKKKKTTRLPTCSISCLLNTKCRRTAVWSVVQWHAATTTGDDVFVLCRRHLSRALKVLEQRGVEYDVFCIDMKHYKSPKDLAKQCGKQLREVERERGLR